MPDTPSTPHVISARGYLPPSRGGAPTCFERVIIGGGCRSSVRWSVASSAATSTTCSLPDCDQSLVGMQRIRELVHPLPPPGTLESTSCVRTFSQVRGNKRLNI